MERGAGDGWLDVLPMTICPPPLDSSIVVDASTLASWKSCFLVSFFTLFFNDGRVSFLFLFDLNLIVFSPFFVLFLQQGDETLLHLSAQ